MIAHSPDVAYLREPVNQPYQDGVAKETVVNPDSDDAILRCYTRLADRAFAGVLPWRAEDVLERVDHFALRRRRARVLVIKEVNPLAAGFYVRRYRPKLVVIVRHPAAVAESYERMGWLDGAFEELGYLYGVHLAAAIAAGEAGWLTTIRFEDLAMDPRGRFPALFSSLGLRLPDRFDALVTELCESAVDSRDAYALKRSSRREANKWRDNLSAAQIAAVMAGYSRSPLGFYRDAE